MSDITGNTIVGISSYKNLGMHVVIDSENPWLFTAHWLSFAGDDVTRSKQRVFAYIIL